MTRREARSPAERSEAPNEPEGFGLSLERGHLRLYSRHAERRAPERRREPSPLMRVQEREGRELLAALQKSRELGLYVSGLPGVGKSTLLLHLILEDIRTGTACCVIDPHGDLVTAVLERCPSDPATLERILVFDPADTERPVGLDILAAETERERELAVQFMLGLYEELFLREHQGPILHQSLANGLRLLIEQGRSLAELPVLFTEQEFLEARLALCKNPWVRHYFEQVWKGLRGSRDGGEYVGYFTSKIAPFMDDPMLRNILAQKEGPDLAGHLNGGGVVLANLSRGALGDTNARLLGMILLHKLEQITMARSSVEPAERRPLRVYVDEFHELAGGNLARFLGAARKFNVGLTLAHQRLDTVPLPLADTLQATIAHWALFRQPSQFVSHDLSKLLWPRFGDRELSSVANYTALMRVAGPGGEPQIGRLSVPDPGPGRRETARLIRKGSRERFGAPREQVEREVLKRLGWALADPDAEEETRTLDGAVTAGRGGDLPPVTFFSFRT